MHVHHLYRMRQRLYCVSTTHQVEHKGQRLHGTDIEGATYVAVGSVPVSGPPEPPAQARISKWITTIERGTAAQFLARFQFLPSHCCVAIGGIVHAHTPTNVSQTMVCTAVLLSAMQRAAMSIALANRGCLSGAERRAYLQRYHWRKLLPTSLNTPSWRVILPHQFTRCVVLIYIKLPFPLGCVVSRLAARTICAGLCFCWSVAINQRCVHCRVNYTGALFCCIALLALPITICRCVLFF